LGGTDDLVVPLGADVAGLDRLHRLEVELLLDLLGLGGVLDHSEALLVRGLEVFDVEVGFRERVQLVVCDFDVNLRRGLRRRSLRRWGRLLGKGLRGGEENGEEEEGESASEKAGHEVRGMGGDAGEAAWCSHEERPAPCLPTTQEPCQKLRMASPEPQGTFL
jgi:hypothetical protein